MEKDCQTVNSVARGLVFPRKVVKTKAYVLLLNSIRPSRNSPSVFELKIKLLKAIEIDSDT